MRKILVIGSNGQIGSELVPELGRKYGSENVISSDLKPPLRNQSLSERIFVQLDVFDVKRIEEIVKEHEINTIFHLASLLSVKGENKPLKTWDLNVNGLLNILEIGRKFGIKNIIWPSSIAVFGPKTPSVNTPNETILQPNTIYGITKVSGELLVDYYFKKYGLDVRSVRLPGIISSETRPGGGTTDYAVEIFHEAILHKKYECFVNENTVLPMMYIPDCIKCMIDLLEADSSKLKRRVYNVTSMSFSVGELATEIRNLIPDFIISYKPDFRQQIADSWPKTVDDSLARKEWAWKPNHDLHSMTADMINKLKKD
jgi:nucleoside-diphosphate-sugar epimerase